MEVVRKETQFGAVQYNYSFSLTLNEIKIALFSIVKFNYASKIFFIYALFYECFMNKP